MGKIYLARDPKLGRDVAIKLLMSTTDRDIRERFRLEARAIAALKHPNIVELYDYSGENADDLFLVLEYIPGRSLHEQVVERGNLSEVTALCIAHELVLALDHAHSHNVVHRDLKPENVLLSNGRVVLTDFGIVKQIAAEGALGLRKERSATQVLGTPGFMAPEQIAGRGVTAATDIFALGAMLYNLTTGRPPFSGANLAQIAEAVRKGTYEDPRHASPLLSDGFCNLMARCMRPKPKDRFASAEATREVVLDVLRAHGVTEVRREIVDYEKNPATHAIEQRERALEVLMRDLKIAVKDRDEPGLQAVIARMQTIAPLENKIRGVTGIHWDKKHRPRLSREVKRALRWPWFVLGSVLGLLLGACTSLSLLAMGVVPTEVMHWFELLADWVGVGY
jgi:serine/threonine-protein kinase